MAGATSATLTLTEVDLSADGNEHRVAVFNEAGKVTSGVATLTVIPVPVVPPAVERGERLAGSDRYGTNLALLRATFEAGDPLFVATGAVYADALSAGPAVVVEDGSLALTPPKALDLELKRFLEANKPSKIYVVGGKGAVSAGVADQLGKIAPVERVSGKDRYETSLEVFDRFFAGAPLGRVASRAVFVATGQDFPDALSAAVPASGVNQRLVLAYKGCIPGPVVPEWIKGENSTVAQVTLVGCIGVLSNAVQNLTACVG